jgi:hypothetical protein
MTKELAMAKFYPILDQLLLMAVLIILGIYLNRSGKINESAENSIAQLMIDVAFPALIFTNIVIDFDFNMLREYIIIPITSLIISFISLMTIFFIIKKLNFSKKEGQELAFVTAFSNNIIVGSPICIALFGAQGLILAILYDFGMQITVWTFGVGVLKGFESGRDNNYLKNILSPPIIGLILGVLVIIFGINVPDSVLNITGSISDITIPLAMIFIGLQLAKSDFKKVFSHKKIYFVAALKLVFFPLLVYSILSLFTLSPILKGVITLLSAMPVFASSAVILEKYGYSSHFASMAIFATIVFMIFTLPVFIYLVI